MSTNRKLPLVEALGYQYINEFFRSALFVRDRKIFCIRSCDSTTMAVHAIDMEAESKEWKTETLPANTLNSFSDIRWPKLGYRNLPDKNFGNVVSFLTSQRSVQRGLKWEHMSFETLPVLENLTNPGMGRMVDTIIAVFFPVWYKFKEGMDKIDLRECAAFALSEDVAIGLSVDQGDNRYCDIYFRGKVVGLVKENREILVANKTIKRGNIKQLYRLLES